MTSPTPSATFEPAPGRERRLGDVGPLSKSDIEQPIHRRFAKIAQTYPNRIAVSRNGVSWTYAELRRASRGVAEALGRLGGDRGRPVGLVMKAGASLFASMLGALEAGRFYVPMDLGLGEARLRAILAESAADVLVTDSVGAAFLERVGTAGARVLRVEDAATTVPGDGPAVAVLPDDLAYLLFTSGSTGRPKGVLQTHRNVLHNTFKLTTGLRLTSEDRLTLLSSCSLGASVSDIFGALLNGATVCPFSLAGGGLLELPSFIARERITVYHSVPSVFRRFAAMLDGSEDLSSLRVVKLGGEPVLASDLDLHRRHMPESCLFHVGLGATEMSVMRQWFADHETPCPWPVAPLGYPVDDTEIVLLDEKGQPAAGDTGEIAVMSPTLAVGYWRQPQETAQAFQPVPGREGWRIYRTGDLGRLLPDGCLLYLGRCDSRVKVRGYKVEVLQVEAEIARQPGVREAAVAAREGPAGTRLVAYIVPESGRLLRVETLRKVLRERLSDAELPSAFVFLDALPLTGGGKVDRQALPAPDSARPNLETPFVEPQDGAAAEIARIFAELLELDEVGSEDDFFDLGGDSLLVVEAILRLEKAFDRRLSPADFLENPTPAALASKLSAADASSEARVVTLQAGSGQRPIFLVPAGAGRGEELLVHARLARHLGHETTVIGLRAGSGPHPPAGELAAEYVERIRSIQPTGPYMLIGECVGGILAFEMARRLSQEGERVAFLALLDTPYPTAHHRMRDRLRRLREPWGDDLGRRLQHHRRVVAKLESGRLAYLLARARTAARALASLVQPARRRLLRRRATYVGSLLRWRPQRFDGTISFVESMGERRQRNSARWSAPWAALAADARVVQVPGNHHTYIREHAGSVAAALRQWLDEIGSQSASSQFSAVSDQFGASGTES
jgi:amino acid adenylation domain-containing protein